MGAAIVALQKGEDIVLVVSFFQVERPWIDGVDRHDSSATAQPAADEASAGIGTDAVAPPHAAVRAFEYQSFVESTPVDSCDVHIKIVRVGGVNQQRPDQAGPDAKGVRHACPERLRRKLECN